MENCFEIKRKKLETTIKVDEANYTLVQRPLTRSERLKIEQITCTIEDEEGGFELMMKVHDLRKPIDNLIKEDKEENEDRIKELEQSLKQTEEYKKFYQMTKKVYKKNEEANYQMTLISLSDHSFYKNENKLPDGFSMEEILDILSDDDFKILIDNAKKLTYFTVEEEELVK